MASTSTSGPSCPVIFTSQTPYPLPSQKFMIPAAWKRFQLSQLINKALSLEKPVPFDFIINGEILRGTLGEWCAEHGVGEEETLEIEYIESVVAPQKVSNLPHEDWVSSVSSELESYFLTASYDGNVRVFDYSRNLVTSIQAHSAPITQVSVIPSTSNISDDGSSSHLIATSSHDLTAQISRLSLKPQTAGSESESRVLASLHLHTSPVSSIASNSTGTHLLTSSWDGLVGFWDTSIPAQDEVPEVESEGDRKKRRKLGADGSGEKVKRKAPLLVLKSHTSRVSRVIFGHVGQGNGERTAYSCGFDSTVRMWDTENGICTHTITASEKPFVDIALTSDGSTALAASTDRTISLYDFRIESTATTTSSGSLVHPATPSCIAAGSTPHQVVSGAYDGVVRIWDLRSVKGAMLSFKAWDGQKKVLSVDWRKGVVGVGGEGGLEIWRAGESPLSS